MFKFLPKILIVSMLLVMFVGCSTNKLYTMAINHERSNANLEKKSIKLDFGEIVYLENNVKSDTVVVLLHGFGADKDNWNRFSAQLNDKYHIIIPDLSGHGESISSKKLGYTITHHAKMLHEFLKAKNINKIDLVGNSMGGAIAIMYNNNYKNVNSLTLIDSLGMIKTKSKLSLLIEKSGKNPFLNVCTEEAFNTLLHIGMEKPPYIPSIFMDLLISKKCARADIENIMYIELLSDADLSNIVKKIKIPTLIIWGKKDSVLHVDNAKLFSETIKGSQLFVLDGLGHVPFLEDSQKTAEIFKTFIKQNK